MEPKYIQAYISNGITNFLLSGNYNFKEIVVKELEGDYVIDANGLRIHSENVISAFERKSNYFDDRDLETQADGLQNH